VRPGAGVEYHRSLLVGGRVQPGQHLVLVVGLAHLDVEAELLAGRLAQLDQTGVGGQPVHVDLPGAEATQVGPVEHVDLHADTSR
jgi:multidrug resistance efflux pump